MLEQIKAGGKNRPFASTFRARAHFEAWQAEQSKKLPQGKKNYSTVELVDLGISGVIRMAFEGFKYGAIKAGQPVEFTLNEVEAWLDDDHSLADTVVKLWELEGPKPVEAAEEEKKQKAQKES